MAGVNQLLPFANGETPNVIPYDEWNALAARLSGFQSGIASSKQFNYILAQGGAAGYVIGQMVADYTTETATIAATPLYQAFKQAMSAFVGQSDITATGSTTARSLEDRFADIVNVKDFGAVGDGVTDDTEAIQAAFDFGRGNTVFIPAGVYLVSRTLIARAGSKIVGSGMVDYWGADMTLGTVIKTVGSGNPAIWTDIYEGDETQETPMLVAGGNGIFFEGFTLTTEGDTPWSIGLFFPSVKQCGYSRINAFYFTNAPIYLDVTWSDRNEYLKGLHPDIEPSHGMNEFYGENFFAAAGGTHASIGLKIQGTTRNPDDYASTDDWLWGWGGASDIVFMKGRANGIWVDGRIKGNAGNVIQGIRFICVDSRTGNRETMIHVGYASRVDFIGGYGEATPGVTAKAEFYSYTGQVNFLFTEYRADTYFDDVATGYRLTNGPIKGSQVTIVNSSGEIYKSTVSIREETITPNTDGGYSVGTSDCNCNLVNTHNVRSSNEPLVLRVTNSDVLSLDSNTIISTTRTIRPSENEVTTFGTTSYRLSNLMAKQIGYNTKKTDAGYFENIYTTSGTVSTSDERQKDFIVDVDDALMRAWEKVNFKLFKFKDAIEKKGEDSARIHAGVIAQQVIEAFESEGLDPFKYGLVCYDEWEDQYEDFLIVDEPEVLDENGNVLSKAVTHTERRKVIEAGNKYAIRYEELFAVGCACQNKRINDLESTIEKLVEKVGGI